MVISYVSRCNLYPQWRYSSHKTDSVWNQKKPILTCMCVWNIWCDTKVTANHEANSHKIWGGGEKKKKKTKIYIP